MFDEFIDNLVDFTGKGDLNFRGNIPLKLPFCLYIFMFLKKALFSVKMCVLRGKKKII